MQRNAAEHLSRKRAVKAQHFGDYLQQQRIVGKDDIGHILETQDRQRPSIGEMAVAGGFMDYNDVQRVLKTQEETHELFGRISMNLGLLDREKVGFLLRAQTQESRRIGELLVEQRLIGQDVLRRELKNFAGLKRKNRRRRVLIVGSGPQAQQAIGPLTKPMRLETVREPDPRRAAATAHRRRPDIVVVAIDPQRDDCSLGETVALLSENWQTANVPTLVMPAPADAAAPALPGNMEAIAHPFDSEAVRRAIEGIEQGERCDTAPHVLVIDVNPLMRALICQELIDAGMTLFRAESVAKAFAVAQTMTFDLAIIGECPDSADLEALRNLRRLAGAPLLRVAGREAETPPGLPVDEFKGPFLPGELARHVDGMLERARLRRRKTAAVMSPSVSLRETLAHEMGQAGFNAVELANTEELLAYVQRHHADLFAIDADGSAAEQLDLLRHARRQGDALTMPIVLITGIEGGEFARQALAAGAGDVVRKPFDAVEVSARARRLVEAKTRIESLQAECRRLEKLSVTDPLTGLANRRHYLRLAEQEVGRSRRYNRKPVSVIMLDIDDFKHFNDTYGHRHGDLILREIAQILRARTRITDVVARYGGEEFAILLPETSADGALVVAENLRRAIEKAGFFGGEYAELVTVSLGVGAFDPRGGASIDEAILQADRAMYRAKDAGKNRTEVDPKALGG